MAKTSKRHDACSSGPWPAKATMRSLPQPWRSGRATSAPGDHCCSSWHENAWRRFCPGPAVGSGDPGQGLLLGERTRVGRFGRWALSPGSSFGRPADLPGLSCELVSVYVVVPLRLPLGDKPIGGNTDCDTNKVDGPGDRPRPSFGLCRSRDDRDDPGSEVRVSLSAEHGWATTTRARATRGLGRARPPAGECACRASRRCARLAPHPPASDQPRLGALYPAWGDAGSPDVERPSSHESATFTVCGEHRSGRSHSGAGFAPWPAVDAVRSA